MGAVIPDEVGQKYEVGIVSPTFGQMGFAIKPGTYHREQQLIKRQDVVAALQTALADRDLDFWTRVSQTDWRSGSGTVLFVNGAFWDSRSIDSHAPGQLSLLPQPSVLSSTTLAQAWRGAVVAPQGVGGAAAFFCSWTAGNYAYSTNIASGAPVFATAATDGAGGKVLDIVTDGVTVYFALSGTGVWKTTASAPGALSQFDVGATGPYHRLVYDPLRKKLFGLTAPGTATRLEQINSGGAPTVIYDFVTGRLDAIENAFGSIIMAWNTGDAQDGSTTRSMLYYYNGTSVLEYAYGPDSTQIVSLKAEVGTLWVSLISQDPYNAALDPVGGTGFGIGYVSNAVVLLYWNIVDGRLLRDSGSKSDFHSLQHFTSVPMSPPYNTGSTWVSAKGSLFHYDLAAGGFARSFGAESVVIAGTTYDVQITGVAVVQQKFIALAQLLTAGTTTPVGAAVLQLSGTGLSPNAGSYPGENKLISSRFDLGLPYVPKYWYSFETVLTSPLIAGQSVTMEYSLDDGTTWNACGGSPWQTIGQQRVNLTVQRVNPHVRYRVGLYATGGAVSPVVSSIAAKFAPSNPSAKVWTMTLPCFDQMMFRGQQIDDGYYGQDRMSFLFNIAQQSEVVTFYDNNEPITAGQPTSARTPHTVWVLSADDVRAGQTGGVYNPLRTEGEVQLVLWEVTA